MINFSIATINNNYKSEWQQEFDKALPQERNVFECTFGLSLKEVERTIKDFFPIPKNITERLEKLKGVYLSILTFLSLLKYISKLNYSYNTYKKHYTN